MSYKLIKLLGRKEARKLDKERWIFEMRILRSIQLRHPHWYQRLFSRDILLWLKIDKTPYYYSHVHHCMFYKPLYRAI